MISCLIILFVCLTVAAYLSKEEKEDRVSMFLIVSLVLFSIGFLGIQGGATLINKPELSSTQNVSKVDKSGDYIAVTLEDGKVKIIEEQNIEFVPSDDSKIETYSNSMYPWFINMDSAYKYKIYLKAGN